ncbi:hypothetical protein P8935_01510 [Telmatobacter sp. DSM 110680]|uniref:Uncharacterized protein n=1 Tax=Telmatobacter sp. DSM 110680 TaxID=3036704 RepID=A0AAU7DLS0_9BACT
MKTSGAEAKVIHPWSTVSSVDIQRALDSEIARTIGKRKSKRKIAPESLPSIREALIQVLRDNDALQSEAEEKLEDENPETVLVSFLGAEPEWVIRCSVTDSMVSGVWGFKYFVLGSRGYLYYHPNFGIDDTGECLPIVGTWAPSTDESAALDSLKDAYIAYWMDFALPPLMGQWARGPKDFLATAVGTVLQQRPTLWSDVLDRLHRDIEEDDRLVPFLVEQVSSQTSVEESAVSGILKTFHTGRKIPASKLTLSELESRVFVAAFVARIGMNGI